MSRCFSAKPSSGLEYGAALQDASEAIQLDRSFLKAYYRRAAANFALMRFKDALRDYQTVAKARPKDADAQSKLKECDKIVKRLAFEKAIAVQEPETESLESRLQNAINFLRQLSLAGVSHTHTRTHAQIYIQKKREKNRQRERCKEGEREKTQGKGKGDLRWWRLRLRRRN